MAEYHPATAHFPVVLLFLWPIMDLIGIGLGREDVSRTALSLLGVALLAALIATLTGQAAYDEAVAGGYNVAVLEQHSKNADLLPWGVLVVLLVRSVGVHKFGRRAHILALVMGIVLWGMLGDIATSGGDLVFGHGVGVRLPSKSQAR